MSLTPSSMLPLGTKAPHFILTDAITNESLSLMDLKSDIATVIMFICNHCPYVQHIQSTLIEIAKHYQTKDISFIAICANDIENYPADNPENMRKVAKQKRYSFPYLFDSTQEVAKAYQAACTPDFYVFDKNLACVYRGRFDASTPKNSIPVTGGDLVNALEAILNKQPVSEQQYPSIGCNIKWKN